MARVTFITFQLRQLTLSQYFIILTLHFNLLQFIFQVVHIQILSACPSPFQPSPKPPLPYAPLNPPPTPNLMLLSQP